MKRTPFFLSAMAIAMVCAGAAEPVPSTAAAQPPPTEALNPALGHGARVTLAELKAQPKKEPNDPEFLAFARQMNERAMALIESNTLNKGEQFFDVSNLVYISDNAFRGDRVRYELLLSAAALGHTEAEKTIARTWDQLLKAIGRPLRTDFGGLQQQNPDFYTVDPAPACVQAVLRDPAAAREAGKTSESNVELTTIVNTDQADRQAWNKHTPEEKREVAARDRARNRRTQEIIAAGELHTAQDFAHAALVMQHSANFSGYQTAHELAVCSLLLGDRGSGRWLVAATYDRMLGSVGHDQRFGTQYRGMNGMTELATVDPAGICDAERKALGCPTLEEAKDRRMNSANTAKTAKLLADFTGPGRLIHDPKFGMTATYPEDWHFQAVNRWGDQETTLSFEIAGAPEASPNLYYRIFHQPRPMSIEEAKAFFIKAAKNKETSRRQTLSDYTNQPESSRFFTIQGNPAMSWSANFTSVKGDKWVEYFVRIETPSADAFLFLQTRADQLERLKSSVDQLMEGLKMPMPESADVSK